MTTHMAWLPTGERIEVTERKCDGYTHPVFGIYTQYEYVDGVGVLILPHLGFRNHYTRPD